MSSEEKSDVKSDDDDFDSLCKEFEDDNTDNMTVIENLAEDAQKDETIAEIDSFLEESIDLRTGILSSTVCESSTPIRSTFLPSTSSDVSASRVRRVSSGHSDLWSTIDQQTDRAVSSAGSEESRPIENDSANRSIILAGNLADVCDQQKNEDELAKEKLEEETKKEERKKAEEERKRLDEEQLDLSLLEKEKWEDDYEVTGFSVTDIMNEMDDMDVTLLYEPDIESEEEEDKDSDGDITVVAVINNKDEEKAQEKEKTKKERRANTTAIKDSKEWREELMKSKKQNKIKQKYYERAVSEWKKFTQGTNFTIPDIYETNEPRIYKDKNGDIVGFDMPDEYIDNNHPVWQEDRDLYHLVMRGERKDEEFAKYIHTKWGWTNKIDMTRNLTNFPIVSDEQRNGGLLSKGVSGKGSQGSQKRKGKNADTTVTTLTNQQTINEMLAIVDEVGEVEEGEERLKTWRQIQENIQKSEANQTPEIVFDSKINQTPDLADSKTSDAKIVEDLPCGYCRKFCMCSPGHKKVSYVKSGKRKRFRSASVDKCNEESGAKIRKMDYMDEVSAASSRRSGGLERTAGILGSVGEVFTFNQMYQGKDNEPWLSEEQAKELNSLEDMYDVFKSHYSSPYAKDNRNSKPKQNIEVDADKSETWDDLLEDI